MRETSMEAVGLDGLANAVGEWARHHDDYGLCNYQFVVGELDRLVKESTKAARRGRTPPSLTLALINMDCFKTINSAVGTVGGDILVAVIAERIQSILREEGKEGWTLCRTRGDEFALLIEGQAPGMGEAQVLPVLEKLRDAVYEPCTIPCFTGDGVVERTVYPSASIGVLTDAQLQSSAARILEMTTDAMRASKKLGLGKITFYKEGEFEVEGDDGVESAKLLHRRYEIQEGLKPDQEQFVPYFQPIHLCSDGRLSGFETLVRWRHPTEYPEDNPGAPLPPGAFINYAKRSGIVGEIDQRMMQRAMELIRKYPGYPFYLSVNGTPDLLQCDDIDAIEHHPIARFMRELMELRGATRRGVDTSRFAIEVVEDALDGKRLNRVIGVLEYLKRKYDIQIFLDDFGAGYSSLERIPMLPIDCIKIDQSFVNQAVPDPRRPLKATRGIDHEQSRKLLQAIVNMANDLGKDTVAEGVETVEQLTWLREAGCRKVQGYLFSRPMPLDAVGNYIEKHRTRE